MPVRKIKIGNHAYLWTTRGEDEAPDKCVISAHGQRYMVNVFRDRTFTVPAGTTIRFFAPDHYFLADPGLEGVLRGEYVPIPEEDVGPGEACLNYELAKYQGYHDNMLGTLAPLIKKSLVAMGYYSQETKDSWESYAKVIAALEDRQTWAQQGYEREANTVAQTRSARARARWKLVAAEYAMSSASEQARGEVRRKARLAVDNENVAMGFYEPRMRRYKEILDAPPMDLITIRYRPFKTHLSLSGLIRDLKSAGIHYDAIHCSFCRGSVGDYVYEATGMGTRTADARKRQ